MKCKDVRWEVTTEANALSSPGDALPLENFSLAHTCQFLSEAYCLHCKSVKIFGNESFISEDYSNSKKVILALLSVFMGLWAILQSG